MQLFTTANGMAVVTTSCPKSLHSSVPSGLCYSRLRGVSGRDGGDKCCLEIWRRERGLFSGVACTGHLERVRNLRLEQEMDKRGCGAANGCARDQDCKMQAIWASFRLIGGVCVAPVVLKPVTALLQFSTVTCLPFCTERVPSPSHRPPLQLRFAHFQPPTQNINSTRARVAPGIHFQGAKRTFHPRF
jgi:hypothetical protein